MKNKIDSYMNIVIGASEEYAFFSGPMLISLFENNPGEKFNIYFYYDKLSDDVLNSLRNFIESNGNNFYPMFVSEGRKKQLNETLQIHNIDWWHSATWFRYYCIQDLAGLCDRVLLMGTDIIVQKPIREYYDTNMDNKFITGIVDMGMQRSSKADTMHEFEKNTA